MATPHIPWSGLGFLARQAGPGEHGHSLASCLRRKDFKMLGWHLNSSETLDTMHKALNTNKNCLQGCCIVTLLHADLPTIEEGLGFELSLLMATQ